jgi:CO dehydrogenase maturation factor
MRALIHERTGASAETFGKFFKINPKVDDIPDMLAIEKNGVKLLVMGTIETGGSGCVCPEHAMLKRIISHLIIARDDVVIMDMEAGLEHLGRGTADSMDQFIVVVSPENGASRLNIRSWSWPRIWDHQGARHANKERCTADEEYLGPGYRLLDARFRS